MKKIIIKTTKNAETNSTEYAASFKSFDLAYLPTCIASESIGLIKKWIECEFLRFEYHIAYCDYMNTGSQKSLAITNAIESETGFPVSDLISGTNFSNIPFELRRICLAIIVAHGKFLNNIKESQNDDGTTEYTVSARFVSFETSNKDFSALRSKCIDAIHTLEFGNTDSINSVISDIKPLYSAYVSQFDTIAVDGICKMYKESTRNIDIRRFLLGLTNTYKLNKMNVLDAKSPLRSFESFQTYCLSWLVAGGNFASKKKTIKPVETADSILANL